MVVLGLRKLGFKFNLIAINGMISLN